ncbi:MAG: flavin reductase family protein [Acidobacteriia bacterium]|nr:flavin reductase family protein [Terriglobia bacterium]
MFLLSPIDPRTFRRACSKFATGITIVTLTGTDGLPHGMTVNAFTSVSLSPPLVLVCVDHSSSLLAHFRAATHYGVNVLNKTQQDLSNRFAMRGLDRFLGLSWDKGSSGVPLLPGSLAHMECEIRNTFTAGDHDIFIAEVMRVHIANGEPLLFFDGGYPDLT